MGVAQSIEYLLIVIIITYSKYILFILQFNVIDDVAILRILLLFLNVFIYYSMHGISNYV